MGSLRVNTPTVWHQQRSSYRTVAYCTVPMNPEPCAIFPPLTSFLQLFLLPGLVLIWRYLACLWNSQRGYISLGDLHSPSLHHCPAMRNRTNMASISAAVASSSCFSQGESPPLPTPRSIEDLMNWFSSELHVGPHPVGMQTFMC